MDKNTFLNTFNSFVETTKNTIVELTKSNGGSINRRKDLKGRTIILLKEWRLQEISIEEDDIYLDLDNSYGTTLSMSLDDVRDWSDVIALAVFLSKNLED